MRRLVCLAVLAVAAGCGAPDPNGAPAAESPSNNPNTFRADADEERGYAGEWALAADHCDDQGKVWTVETNRIGMQRERFCVFERIYVSGRSEGEGEAWSASAKCLAEGKESHDFLFFRVRPTRQEMRITINDSTPVDLVRCPMRT